MGAQNVREPFRVWESSIGSGVFFALMPESMRQNPHLERSAVEMDPLTAAVSQVLFPEDRIVCAPLQNVVMREPVDLIVGNPPFGAQRLLDMDRSDLSRLSPNTHSYFFAKSIDSLNPNGVAALVVSRYLLDANREENQEFRRWMHRHAELLHAVRLPETAFAKTAFTEVVTDIIVLRKRPEPLPMDTPDPDWIDGQVPLQASWEGKEITANGWFAAREHLILGTPSLAGKMYGKPGDQFTVKPGETPLEVMLQEHFIDALPEGIYRDWKPVAKDRIDGPVLPEIDRNTVGRVQPYGYFVVPEQYKEDLDSQFGVTISGFHVARRRPDDFEGGFRYSLVSEANAKHFPRLAGLCALRDLALELTEWQVEPNATDSDLMPLRARLNRTYDQFTKLFGLLNSPANSRLLRGDPGAAIVMGLERDYDAGVSREVAKKTGEAPRKPSAKKSDLFTKRTQFPIQPVEHADSAKDALFITLAEGGEINWRRVGQLTGFSWEQIAVELALETPAALAFETPEGMWLERSAFLSGDVKNALDAIDAALQGEVEDRRRHSLEASREALLRVIPEPIPAELITVQPGAPFVPMPIVRQYLDSIGLQSVSADYYPYNGMWHIRGKATGENASKYAISGRSLEKLVEDLFSHRSPIIYDHHSDGSRTVNEEETALAMEKVKALREHWSTWLQDDPARMKVVAEEYNRLFNRVVQREYDGRFLTLPGTNASIQLRPHQKNAVWRACQSKSVLFDHKVGAGKTFAAIAAVMEKRRMGQARKPIVTVPNHLVGQWASAWMALYPSARILVADDQDMDSKHRQEFLARAAYNDWDAVITSHSAFKQIPVDPEFYEEFIWREMLQIDDLIEHIEGSDKMTLKQMEKKRQSLQERMKTMHNRVNSKRDDGMLHFGEIGFDYIVNDESHSHKNVPYMTTLKGVSGLGNPAGSERAEDMMIKVTQAREAGAGVLFLTGTPISNTIAEMYLLTRYLAPEILEQQGLYSFDGWVSTFATVTEEFAFTLTGQFKSKKILSEFNDVPTLVQLYKSFSDIIGQEDIDRLLKAEGKPPIPMPRIRGGKPQIVTCPMSYEQRRIIGEEVGTKPNGEPVYADGSILDRLDNLPKKPGPGEDNILVIINDLKKASLDARAFDPSAEAAEVGKIPMAVDRMMEIYARWQEDRGTQLIYLDFSTPKGARGKLSPEVRELLDLIAQVEAGEDEEASDSVRHRGELAAEKLAKFSPMEVEEAQRLARGQQVWSAYEEIRDQLIARGVPPDEIAFIHDANTDLRKDELFGKVRSGAVRFLLGSTGKMGPGMNVQDRLVGIHHLDAPYRPSDVEQRNGRIIRQGNKLLEKYGSLEVDINYYVTENSSDAGLWQILETKDKFINSIRFASGSRTAADPDAQAMDPAAVKAMASGHELLMAEVPLRARLHTLERLERAYKKENYIQHRQLEYSREAVAEYERASPSWKADAEFAVEVDRTIEERRAALQAKQVMTFHWNGVLMEGYDIQKEVAAAIERLFGYQANRRAPIGNFEGFEFAAERGSYPGEARLKFAGPSGEEYSGKDFEPKMGTDYLQRFRNLIRSLPNLVAKRKDHYQRDLRLIEELTVRVDQHFKGHEELAAVIEQHTLAETLMRLRVRKWDKIPEAIELSYVTPEAIHKATDTSGLEMNQATQQYVDQETYKARRAQAIEQLQAESRAEAQKFIDRVLVAFARPPLTKSNLEILEKVGMAPEALEQLKAEHGILDEATEVTPEPAAVPQVPVRRESVIETNDTDEDRIPEPETPPQATQEPLAGEAAAGPVETPLEASVGEMTDDDNDMPWARSFRAAPSRPPRPEQPLPVLGATMSLFGDLDVPMMPARAEAQPAPESVPARSARDSASVVPSGDAELLRQVPEALAAYLPEGQYAVTRAGLAGPDKTFFSAKMRELVTVIETMPRSYDTDGQGDQALAYLHYFTGSADWYITELDRDTDGQGQIQAFGLADLGMGFPELGYISIPEIVAHGAEMDYHFTPRSLEDIRLELNRKNAYSREKEPAEQAQEPVNTRPTAEDSLAEARATYLESAAAIREAIEQYNESQTPEYDLLAETVEMAKLRVDVALSKVREHGIPEHNPVQRELRSGAESMEFRAAMDAIHQTMDAIKNNPQKVEIPESLLAWTGPFQREQWEDLAATINDTHKALLKAQFSRVASWLESPLPVTEAEKQGLDGRPGIVLRSENRNNNWYLTGLNADGVSAYGLHMDADGNARLGRVDARVVRLDAPIVVIGHEPGPLRSDLRAAGSLIEAVAYEDDTRRIYYRGGPDSAMPANGATIEDIWAYERSELDNGDVRVTQLAIDGDFQHLPAAWVSGMQWVTRDAKHAAEYGQVTMRPFTDPVELMTDGYGGVLVAERHYLEVAQARMQQQIDAENAMSPEPAEPSLTDHPTLPDVTDLESDLIVRIARNEMNSANGRPTSAGETETWADEVLTSKADGGVMSSLVKKNLAWHSHHLAKGDQGVGLTELGFALYQEISQRQTQQAEQGVTALDKVLLESAEIHGVDPEELAVFVADTVRIGALDEDRLNALYPPDADWRARSIEKTALMTDLVPVLKERAMGRSIAGLSAYDVEEQSLAVADNPSATPAAKIAVTLARPPRRWDALPPLVGMYDGGLHSDYRVRTEMGSGNDMLMLIQRETSRGPVDIIAMRSDDTHHATLSGDWSNSQDARLMLAVVSLYSDDPVDALRAAGLDTQAMAMPSNEEIRQYLQQWMYGKPMVGAIEPEVREFMQSRIDHLQERQTITQDHESLDARVMEALSRNELVMAQARNQHNTIGTFMEGGVVGAITNELLAVMDDPQATPELKAAAKEVLQGPAGMTDYRQRIGQSVYEAARSPAIADPTPDTPTATGAPDWVNQLMDVDRAEWDQLPEPVQALAVATTQKLQGIGFRIESLQSRRAVTGNYHATVNVRRDEIRGHYHLAATENAGTWEVLPDRKLSLTFSDVPGGRAAKTYPFIKELANAGLLDHVEYLSRVDSVHDGGAIRIVNNTTMRQEDLQEALTLRGREALNVLVASHDTPRMEQRLQHLTEKLAEWKRSNVALPLRVTLVHEASEAPDDEFRAEVQRQIAPIADILRVVEADDKTPYEALQRESDLVMMLGDAPMASNAEKVLGKSFRAENRRDLNRYTYIYAPAFEETRNDNLLGHLGTKLADKATLNAALKPEVNETPAPVEKAEIAEESMSAGIAELMLAMSEYQQEAIRAVGGQWANMTQPDFQNRQPDLLDNLIQSRAAAVSQALEDQGWTWNQVSFSHPEAIFKIFPNGTIKNGNVVDWGYVATGPVGFRELIPDDFSRTAEDFAASTVEHLTVAAREATAPVTVPESKAEPLAIDIREAVTPEEERTMGETMDGGTEFDEFMEIDEEDIAADDVYAASRAEPAGPWQKPVLQGPDLFSDLEHKTLPETAGGLYGTLPAQLEYRWAQDNSRASVRIARTMSGSYQYAVDVQTPTQGVGSAPSVRGEPVERLADALRAGRQKVLDTLETWYAGNPSAKLQQLANLVASHPEGSDTPLSVHIEADERTEHEMLVQLRAQQQGDPERGIVLRWGQKAFGLQNDEYAWEAIIRQSDTDTVPMTVLWHGEDRVLQRAVDPLDTEAWDRFLADAAQINPDAEILRNLPYGVEFEPALQITAPLNTPAPDPLPALSWPDDPATGELPVESGPWSLGNLDRTVGRRFADADGNAVEFVIGRSEAGYHHTMNIIEAGKTSYRTQPNVRQTLEKAIPARETFAEALRDLYEGVEKEVKSGKKYEMERIPAALVEAIRADRDGRPSEIVATNFITDATVANPALGQMESLFVEWHPATEMFAASPTAPSSRGGWDVRGHVDGKDRHLGTFADWNQVVRLQASVFATAEPALDRVVRKDAVLEEPAVSAAPAVSTELSASAEASPAVAPESALQWRLPPWPIRVFHDAPVTDVQEVPASGLKGVLEGFSRDWSAIRVDGQWYRHPLVDHWLMSGLLAQTGWDDIEKQLNNAEKLLGARVDVFPSQTERSSYWNLRAQDGSFLSNKQEIYLRAMQRIQEFLVTDATQLASTGAFVTGELRRNVVTPPLRALWETPQGHQLQVELTYRLNLDDSQNPWRVMDLRWIEANNKRGPDLSMPDEAKGNPIQWLRGLSARLPELEQQAIAQRQQFDALEALYATQAEQLRDAYAAIPLDSVDGAERLGEYVNALHEAYRTANAPLQALREEIEAAGVRNYDNRFAELAETAAFKAFQEVVSSQQERREEAEAVAKSATKRRGKMMLDLLADDAPAEEVAQAIFQAHGIESKGTPAIVEAIQNRKVEVIQSIIGHNSQNPASQEVFTRLTGVSLGKAQKDRMRAIDEWAGISVERRAEIQEQKKAQREREEHRETALRAWQDLGRMDMRTLDKRICKVHEGLLELYRDGFTRAVLTPELDAAGRTRHTPQLMRDSDGEVRGLRADAFRKLITGLVKGAFDEDNDFLAGLRAIDPEQSEALDTLVAKLGITEARPVEVSPASAPVASEAEMSHLFGEDAAIGQTQTTEAKPEPIGPESLPASLQSTDLMLTELGYSLHHVEGHEGVWSAQYVLPEGDGMLHLRGQADETQEATVEGLRLPNAEAAYGMVRALDSIGLGEHLSRVVLTTHTDGAGSGVETQHHTVLNAVDLQRLRALQGQKALDVLATLSVADPAPESLPITVQSFGEQVADWKRQYHLPVAVTVLTEGAGATAEMVDTLLTQVGAEYQRVVPESDLKQLPLRDIVRQADLVAVLGQPMEHPAVTALIDRRFGGENKDLNKPTLLLDEDVLQWNRDALLELVDRRARYKGYDNERLRKAMEAEASAPAAAAPVAEAVPASVPEAVEAPVAASEPVAPAQPVVSEAPVQTAAEPVVAGVFPEAGDPVVEDNQVTAAEETRENAVTADPEPSAMEQVGEETALIMAEDSDAAISEPEEESTEEYQAMLQAVRDADWQGWIDAFREQATAEHWDAMQCCSALRDVMKDNDVHLWMDAVHFHFTVAENPVESPTIKERGQHDIVGLADQFVIDPWVAIHLPGKPFLFDFQDEKQLKQTTALYGDSRRWETYDLSVENQRGIALPEPTEVVSQREILLALDRMQNAPQWKRIDPDDAERWLARAVEVASAEARGLRRMIDSGWIPMTERDRESITQRERLLFLVSHALYPSASQMGDLLTRSGEERLRRQLLLKELPTMPTPDMLRGTLHEGAILEEVDRRMPSWSRVQAADTKALAADIDELLPEVMLNWDALYQDQGQGWHVVDAKSPLHLPEAIDPAYLVQLNLYGEGLRRALQARGVDEPDIHLHLAYGVLPTGRTHLVEVPRDPVLADRLIAKAGNLMEEVELGVRPDLQKEEMPAGQKADLLSLLATFEQRRVELDAVTAEVAEIQQQILRLQGDYALIEFSEGGNTRVAVRERAPTIRVSAPEEWNTLASAAGVDLRQYERPAYDLPALLEAARTAGVDVEAFATGNTVDVPTLKTAIQVAGGVPESEWTLRVELAQNKSAKEARAEMLDTIRRERGMGDNLEGAQIQPSVSYQPIPQSLAPVTTPAEPSPAAADHRHRDAQQTVTQTTGGSRPRGKI